MCSAIVTPLYQDLRYAFYPNGNVQTITDPLNANQDFSYDQLDRLMMATGPYGASGATATLSYDYDQIGNMTLNSQVSAMAYGYPASGASSVRPHAVTTAGANTYTYDANGNMTAGAGRTIVYNQENKPLTITFGGVTTTFVYDGEGTRLKKIAGSSTVTRYISKLYECDNGSCTRYVWANNARIATIAVINGTVNYWHQDHLGSSTVITDGAGNKVETITYYPYGGTRTNVPGTPVNVPYKYTGQELDSTTGLYDYGARQYEPALGRFTSPDTIVPDPSDPQALNRYAYAKNNPLRYNDPSGHEGEGAVGGDGGGDIPWWCFWCTATQPMVQQQSTQTYAPVQVANYQTPPDTSGGASYSNSNGGAGLIGGQSIVGDRSLDFQTRLADLTGTGQLLPTLFNTVGLGEAAGALYDLGKSGLQYVRGIFGGAEDVSALATKGSESTLRYFESILKPDGKLVGDAGTSPLVRILPGGQNAAESLILDLGQAGRLGKNIEKGFLIDVENLGTLTYRYESKSGGPAIDINIRGLEDIRRIHFK